MITLILHIAPWDWKILEWSLPSWLPTCDEVLICMCRGTWQAPDPTQNPTVPDSVRAIIDTANKPLKTLVYDIPKDTLGKGHMIGEAQARNAATYLVPKRWRYLAPDADEWCTDPTTLRKVAMSAPDDNWAWCCAYRWDVCRVDNEKRVFYSPPQSSRWSIFGGSKPGSYTVSRGTDASPLHTKVDVIHWRDRQESDNQRTFHNSYMGEGFELWRKTVVAQEMQRKTWKADASMWTSIVEIPLDNLGCPPYIGI